PGVRDEGLRAALIARIARGGKYRSHYHIATLKDPVQRLLAHLGAPGPRVALVGAGAVLVLLVSPALLPVVVGFPFYVLAHRLAREAVHLAHRAWVAFDRRVRRAARPRAPDGGVGTRPFTDEEQRAIREALGQAWDVAAARAPRGSGSGRALLRAERWVYGPLRSRLRGWEIRVVTATNLAQALARRGTSAADAAGLAWQLVLSLDTANRVAYLTDEAVGAVVRHTKEHRLLERGFWHLFLDRLAERGPSALDGGGRTESLDGFLGLVRSRIGESTAPRGAIGLRLSSPRWVSCSGCGHRHWGPEGAAGMLLVHEALDGKRSVLLQLRAGRNQNAGTWGLPGGAAEPGEPPGATAVRETFEETGLRLGEHYGLAGRAYVDDHGEWAYVT